jgi:hypothetical protein
VKRFEYRSFFRMTYLRHLSAALTIVCISLLSAGCGPSGPARGPASGKVTVGGKPLPHGSVIFESADGKTNIITPIGSDGTFNASTAEGPGLPIGDYRIGVSPVGVAATVDAPPLVGSAPTESKDPPIPEKYRKPATSPLKARIAPNANPPIALDIP